MKAKHGQHRWFVGAGLISALVASLCCIGPIVMLGLGLGSFAAASWFAAWRPLFLVITFVLLGAGWFLALRRPGCADGTCPTPEKRNRTTLLMLSLATLCASSFAAYPWFSGRLVGANQPTAAVLSANAQTLSVKIPSMDCPACASGLAATIRRQPGVVGAEVTYATKDAIVSYDPDVTDSEKIIAAIDATGFPAERPTGGY